MDVGSRDIPVDDSRYWDQADVLATHALARSLRLGMEEVEMKQLVLNPPTLGFVIGTRAALAFGLGLLAAERIPESRRRAIALTLVAIGVATTIPAAILVFGKRDDPKRVSSADGP